jgi:hypothetical protein
MIIIPEAEILLILMVLGLILICAGVTTVHLIFEVPSALIKQEAAWVAFIMSLLTAGLVGYFGVKALDNHNDNIVININDCEPELITQPTQPELGLIIQGTLQPIEWMCPNNIKVIL